MRKTPGIAGLFVSGKEDDEGEEGDFKPLYEDEVYESRSKFGHSSKALA